MEAESPGLVLQQEQRHNSSQEVRGDKPRGGGSGPTVGGQGPGRGVTLGGMVDRRGGVSWWEEG